MNKVYSVITDKILQELRSNRIPWNKPWNSTNPQNITTKNPYRGINSLLLGFLPYKYPFYVTFNQCKSMGYIVNKGEHGHIVTFWKKLDNDETADGKSHAILRYYTVFNVEQTTIPESEYPKLATLDFVPNDKAESIVNNMPNAPKIDHRGNAAFYSPLGDSVTMPAKETFKSVPEYYGTLFHELTHATGHKTRLDRSLGITSFGKGEYSFEELIAEIGSCFLCNESALEHTIDNSVAYIQSWLHRLESNPDWIVKAAGKAQKAADYIMGRLETQAETD